MKGLSELPWDEKKPEDDFQPWPIRNHLNESIVPGGPVFLRDKWYQIIEHYSSRFLTKEMDRLPALSGSASTFKEHFASSCYLAGLWSGNIPSALLWRTVRCDPGRLSNQHPFSRRRLRRSMAYRAPSLSWASIDGAITYESQTLKHSGYERPEEIAADFDYGVFKVVDDSHLQLAGLDLFGAISEASLLLQGCIIPLNSMYEKPTKENVRDFPDDDIRLLLTEGGIVVGVLYPDIITELQFREHIYC